MTQRIAFRSLLHQGLGEGATPFPGLLHFTLDSYLVMRSVKQGGIKYHFFYSLLWLDLGLNLDLPDRGRTLTIILISHNQLLIYLIWREHQLELIGTENIDSLWLGILAFLKPEVTWSKLKHKLRVNWLPDGERRSFRMGNKWMNFDGVELLAICSVFVRHVSE